MYSAVGIQIRCITQNKTTENLKTRMDKVRMPFSVCYQCSLKLIPSAFIHLVNRIIVVNIGEKNGPN